MRKDFLTTKYYYKTKPDGSKRPPPTMYTSHASSSILIPLDFIAINISAVYTPPYGDNGSVLSYNYSKYYSTEVKFDFGKIWGESNFNQINMFASSWRGSIN